MKGARQTRQEGVVRFRSQRAAFRFKLSGPMIWLEHTNSRRQWSESVTLF